MERKHPALGLSLTTEATNTAEQSGRWARKQTMAIQTGAALLPGQNHTGKQPTNGTQTATGGENLELCGKRRAGMTL